MEYKFLQEAKDALDVESIINELKSTNFSKDNASQGKFVQLLRGLAFSDNPKANEFMEQLDNYISNM